MARTVAISFQEWSDPEPKSVYIELLTEPAPYESGAFYKRELPCILSMLRQLDTNGLETIVVDGYVQVDNTGKPGLGAYLFNNLEQKVPVIGVAKNDFQSLKVNKQELYRGESSKPLYISSIGLALERAVNFIASMHGEFRIPTLLKMLDQETRK